MKNQDLIKIQKATGLSSNLGINTTLNKITLHFKMKIYCVSCENINSKFCI